MANKARERIEALLDDNSFVEIGNAVTARSTDFNIKGVETPGDGVVTGYGLINEELVFIYSQDPEVLGGSVGEMHAKKIVNIYEKAMEMGAPIIALIDSAGLRIQESVDGLEAFGQIYFAQSQASSIIPQISVLLGNCGGGLSVVSKLSDFTFMEKDNAKLFVNSPNAIDGNKTVDSASSTFQAEAGNVDFVGTESEIFEEIKKLISVFPHNYEVDKVDFDITDDLNRGVDIESKIDNPVSVLTELSDNGFVVEVKKDFAKEMVTAFIKLGGAPVGVVANGKADDEFKLTADGCKKAAEFVSLCDSFSVPVLTITNTEGYVADMNTEKSGVYDIASLVYAFATSDVPKVNLLVGNAYGSAYTVMNSKALGADMVYAWPSAKVGMMDSKAAVNIMYANEIKNGENVNDKIAEYDSLQADVNNAARRGYVDSIVQPVDTRKYLISAFEMLDSKLA